MSIVREVISKRMLQVRKASELSQAKTAALLDISDRSYKSYELGKRELPLSVAIGFGKVFDVELTWLLTGETRELSERSLAAVEESSAATYSEVMSRPETTNSSDFGRFTRYIFEQSITKGTKADEEASAFFELLPRAPK